MSSFSVKVELANTTASFPCSMTFYVRCSYCQEWFEYKTRYEDFCVRCPSCECITWTVKLSDEGEKSKEKNQ